MYQFLRAILFWFDPEAVHHFSMSILKIACNVRWIRVLLAKTFSPPNKDIIYLWNIPFQNKVGLGAGFDKNALYLRELKTLGFGFIEIGTVTPQPQKGNEKPRLFRLVKDNALINRMGFNNDGVKVVAERLKLWKSDLEGITNAGITNAQLIIGGNIGKNKHTPNEEAWRDYEICFGELYDWVDYFVVNVSSPNTPGLRELQEKESLRKILSHLQYLNKKQVAPKPLLLKIAPDLVQPQIDDVIELAIEIKLDGLVVANTTISRADLKTPEQQIKSIGAGGLSGKPLTERSSAMVRYIHQKTKGQLPIIASGGIFTAADANEKITAGASLIQVWTGFIYEGPAIVKRICAGLK